VQPHGPYVLVGECFGGIVAYEVARQIQAKGEQVAVLVLMDTQRPTEQIYWRYRVAHAFGPLGEAFFDGRLATHRKALHSLPYAKRIPYVGTRAVRVVRNLPSVWRPSDSARGLAEVVLESGTTVDTRQRIIQARHRYRLTLRRHRPRPYAGPLDLLVNEQFYQRDPALGWDALARGGTRIHQVPGNHDTYIREHLEATAATLRACLDNAQARLEPSVMPVTLPLAPTPASR